MSDWPINQPDDPTRLDVPTDILCSFHYFGDIDMGAMRLWGTRIIGDSGAFSAMSTGKPIEREVFHAWADRWRDALLWVAALDVIGDAEASYQNWQAARRDGLELVPTIHYGEGTAQLDRFAEEGATLIGLGGMVPYSSEKDRLMRWCLMMHRHARDHHPQVRFHGWGISHPYLVDNLPWWSTDSSGFSSCFRFGTLRRWAVAVVGSNIVGAVADTLIFLGVAFGPAAIMPALLGQLVGKLWATVAYLILGWLFARLVLSKVMPSAEVKAPRNAVAT